MYLYIYMCVYGYNITKEKQKTEKMECWGWYGSDSTEGECDGDVTYLNSRALRYETGTGLEDCTG